MKRFMSFVNILPKLMIFCEYLSILRPHNHENRKTGYPGFDSEKPDPFKWGKTRDLNPGWVPGCHHYCKCTAGWNPIKSISFSEALFRKKEAYFFLKFLSQNVNNHQTISYTYTFSLHFPPFLAKLCSCSSSIYLLSFMLP